MVNAVTHQVLVNAQQVVAQVVKQSRTPRALCKERRLCVTYRIAESQATANQHASQTDRQPARQTDRDRDRQKEDMFLALFSDHLGRCV